VSGVCEAARRMPRGLRIRSRRSSLPRDACRRPCLITCG
jgi:hypothetical protein